jgi:hypothetical protein
VKFTQAEMDAIQGRTRKEATDAARKAVLKELGIEDVDNPDAVKTVKGKLTAAEQLAEAQKTAEQKLIEERDSLSVQLAAAKQSAIAAELKRRTELINAELKAAASKLKAEYPKDVVKHLRDEYADEVEALLGDDDKVNEKLVEALVGKAKADRPTWFGNQASGIGSPSNRDGRVPQPGAKELQRASIQNQRRIRGG